MGKPSGGERLKAATACALRRKHPAQLLPLDEPSNHLDLESVLAFETAPAAFPAAPGLTQRLRWSAHGCLFESASGDDACGKAARHGGGY
ncbi:MAG TPA: hypothetical protein DCW29_10610 [Janthinobacterium sp.]|nr:hypothetical protein [Janthinobacterium sp.]